MKRQSGNRLAVLAVLAVLFTAATMPAAAAPGVAWSADAAWSPASFFHWLQSVWTGFLGSDDGPSEASGMANLHGAARNVGEPNGVEAASDLPSDGDTSLSGATLEGSV